MANFCSKCGKMLDADTKFCPVCGTPVSQGEPTVKQPQSEPQVKPEPQPEPTPEPAPEPQPEPRVFSSAAENTSGEAIYGAVGGAAAQAVTGVIPGPFKVLGTTFKSFFSSVGSAFKDPKRLIPAFALATVWLVLNILQACGINPLPTRILSFFTFANGGMSGGVIGAIGGLIGKGIFAGALTSLIGMFMRKKSGGKRSFKDTFLGAFGVTLDTLWAYLTGIGAALLLYLFISGGAVRISFMGGVAASFLSARAALNNGFLHKLISSITASGKTKASLSVGGFIRGLAGGFATAAVLGLTGIRLIPLIIGLVLVNGGTVMLILQATGVVKLGGGKKQ